VKFELKELHVSQITPFHSCRDVWAKMAAFPAVSPTLRRAGHELLVNIA
jgi:hypothetical protein